MPKPKPTKMPVNLANPTARKTEFLANKDPLTGLSKQQELFCLEVVKNGVLTTAYELVFPELCAGKDRMNIGRRACALSKKPEIQKRLGELRQIIREETGISLAEHLNELKNLRDLAKQLKQMGPAVAAETGRGKVSGLYVEKVEHSGVVNIIASPLDEKL